MLDRRIIGCPEYPLTSFPWFFEKKQRGQTYTLHSFNFFFRIATFCLNFYFFSVYQEQERDLPILILLNESALIAKH